MGCLLEGVAVHFLRSNMVVQPIKIDITQDPERNDWASVTFTRKAIDHIDTYLMDKEPIEIRGDDNIIYRGWSSTGDIMVSKNTGTLNLRDPLELLEVGAVEWSRRKTTLRDVVNYLFSQREDPHNVLRGPDFTTDPDVTGYQLYEKNDVTNPLGDETMYADWLVDTLFLEGIFSGPAMFDYNGESPRECLAEACKAFGVEMFVMPDGTFTVGSPDYRGTIYQASVYDTPWKIVGFSVPSFEQPIGPVYVRGVDSLSLGGDLVETIEELPGRYIDKVDHATPWASARMKGYIGEPMAIEYAKSNDLDVLETMARSIIIQRFHAATRGSLDIDPLAQFGGENHPGLDALAGLKPGDVVETVNTAMCDVPEAAFRVEGVSHSASGKSGWRLNLMVSAMVPNEIISRSWHHNPTSAAMDDMSSSEILWEMAKGATPTRGFWPGLGGPGDIGLFYEGLRQIIGDPLGFGEGIAVESGEIIQDFLPNDPDAEEEVDEEIEEDNTDSGGLIEQ